MTKNRNFDAEKNPEKKMARFFGLGNNFTPFWAGFGGSSQKRTSKSTSSQFFALDALIMSSVRPKIVENVSVGVHRSRCVGASAPPFQHPTLWPGVQKSVSFFTDFRVRFSSKEVSDKPKPKPKQKPKPKPIKQLVAKILGACPPQNFGN